MYRKNDLYCLCRMLNCVIRLLFWKVRCLICRESMIVRMIRMLRGLLVWRIVWRRLFGNFRFFRMLSCFWSWRLVVIGSCLRLRRIGIV